MEASLTISGLMRKRQEVTSNLDAAQERVRALVASLDALDATIRLFDPTIDVQTVRVRPTPRRLGVQPGDTVKMVYELLRHTGRAMTMREIMDGIMVHRGMNMGDKLLRDAMRNRIGSSLRGMRERGALISQPGPDGGLVWGVPA